MSCMKPVEAEFVRKARFDACVVGSGPSGAAVAIELADRGFRVLVIERGGTEGDDDGEREIRWSGNMGGSARFRAFCLGGASTLWTGRGAPFRDEELRDRPSIPGWEPDSGWPYDLDELAPDLDRAAHFLGMPVRSYGPEAWRSTKGDEPRFVFREDRLVDEIYGFSQKPSGDGPVDSGELLRDALSERLHVWHDTRAVEVDVDDAGGRVTGLSLRLDSGARVCLEVGCVVLAMGCVENTRMLLASRSVVPEGLGNRHDQLGRYYTDHPFAYALRFRGPGLDALRSRLGNVWCPSARRLHTRSLGFALSPRIKHERGLPSSVGYLLVDSEIEGRGLSLGAALAGRESVYGLPSGRLGRLLARPLREQALAVARRYAQDLPPLLDGKSFSVVVNIEQLPLPKNRITLLDEVDAGGVPLVHVHWDIDEREVEAGRTLVRTFEAELGRLGLPAPAERSAWVDGAGPEEDPSETWHSAAHQAGTTRMSSDPTRGVVDAQGRVHGIEGLYVVGASTFPTTGTSNPTHMIVATAYRSARAVAGALAEAKRTPTIEASGTPRAKVGFVGSGHRVRTVYGPILERLADRLEVVGFYSRSLEKAEAAARTLGGRGFGSMEQLAAATRGPGFLVSSVDDRVNASVAQSLLGLGVPLLLETPPAWSQPQLRALARARPKELPVGVAEQFPFLPEVDIAARAARAGVFGRVLSVANDAWGYDYHGLAAARRLLGLARPVRATAFSQSLRDVKGDARAFVSGSVKFSDGSILRHRFGPVDDIPGLERVLRLEGELATLEIEQAEAPQTNRSRSIQRTRTAGGSERLELAARDMREVVALPTWTRGLTDEQMAVGRHVEQMAACALYDAAPLYPLAEGIMDMEMLLALRISSELGGLPISLPLSTVSAAASKVGRALRR